MILCTYMLFINLRIVPSNGLMCCNHIILDYQKLLISLVIVMWENSISCSELFPKMFITKYYCKHLWLLITLVVRLFSKNQ